jgi:tight adherence protein B
MLLLVSRPEAVAAYNTPIGAAVLLGGLVVSLVCYSVMLKIGALPEEERVLR